MNTDVFLRVSSETSVVQKNRTTKTASKSCGWDRLKKPTAEISFSLRPTTNALHLFPQG